MREISKGGPMISCQVSFYPLGREDWDGPIRRVLALLEGSGLSCQVGEMSTVLKGPSREVFALLERVAAVMDGEGCGFVMPVTFSNVCGQDTPPGGGC